jgi:hypothetical protein
VRIPGVWVAAGELERAVAQATISVDGSMSLSPPALASATRHAGETAAD